MVKERKLNVKNIVKLVIIVVLLIIVIVSINIIRYKNSDKYKLKEIGYNEEQIEDILKLDKEYRKKILSMDYNEFLLDLMKETYFLFENVDRYLEYHKKDENETAKNVVAITNVGSDYDHYTNTKETDTSKDILMLVNKYNYLSKDFAPQNIVEVKNWYCYGDASLREDAYDAFIEMFNAAKKDDVTLIINSGYRDYQDQDDTYQEFYDIYGKNEVDKLAAKPGYSEHQTGLSMDITSYDETADTDFEDTAEFKWLQQNAYKYGFILRYPKGKEKITGYAYEAWHYRYVGLEAASKINELDITFDEYYEYFVK